MFLCAGLDLCDLNFLPVPKEGKNGLSYQLAEIWDRWGKEIGGA